MAGFTRRSLVIGASVAAGVAGARYLGSQLPVLDGTQNIEAPGGEGFLNDASGLSRTPVSKHIILRDEPAEMLVKALRAELKEAADAGRPVNISAARHSMGAQAIPRDGTAITFANNFLEPDTRGASYRVHAGTRWSEIIGALDPIGFSPKVMQSNNDFGVAATFCVNAHGWPVPFGPMGATVRAIEMGVMAESGVRVV